jgi:hypothetical protein
MFDTDPNLIDVLLIGDDCIDDIECDSGYCGRVSETCASMGSAIYVAGLQTTYNGNLGGIEGADGMCSNQAASYGFSGEWVALLSTSSQDAIDRVPDITLADGTDTWSLPVLTILDGPLVSSWETLSTSSEMSSSNIILSFYNNDPVDEPYGFDNDADAWTGSDGYGTYYSGQTCSDWTTTSGLGVTTEADSYQLFKLESNKDCSIEYAVQCVRIEE